MAGWTETQQEAGRTEAQVKAWTRRKKIATRNPREEVPQQRDSASTVASKFTLPCFHVKGTLQGASLPFRRSPSRRETTAIWHRRVSTLLSIPLLYKTPISRRPPQGAPLAHKLPGIPALSVPPQDSQPPPCLLILPLGCSQMPLPYCTPVPEHQRGQDGPCFLQHHSHHRNPLLSLRPAASSLHGAAQWFPKVTCPDWLLAAASQSQGTA